jgi:hypothetical protein
MAATVTKKLELILELKDKIAADAKKSAAGLRDVGNEAQKAQDKITDLASRYSLGARNAELLRKRLDELKASGKASGDAIERASLRYDSAKNALERIERQAQRTAESLNTIQPKGDLGVGKITSAGNALSGLSGTIGTLATGWISLEAITSAWNIGTSIEANRTTLNALIGDVGKGNAAFSEASNFARKYGFTQQEISSVIAAAAPIIRKYNTDTEQTLQVLARLAALNPAEGIEGATVAFKELASGDTTSIVERFNLSRDAAKAMVAEIKAGADPVLTLDRYLNQMGATNELLAARMQGANGATNTFKQGIEDLKLSVFSLLDRLGADDALAFFGKAMSGLATFINEPVDSTDRLAGQMDTMIGKLEAATLAAGGLNQPLSNVTLLMAELTGLQLQAAASSEENAAKAAELSTQFQDGTISAEEYRNALLEMVPAHQDNQDGIAGFNEAVAEQINAVYEATGAIDTNIDALSRLLSGLTDAESATISKFFTDYDAAEAADESAQQNAILGAVLEGLADQTMGPERAMYLLRDAFGVTGDQAIVLFGQLQAVAAALAPLRALMGIGGNIGAAIGNAGSTEIANLAKAKIYSPRSSKVRSGGSGGRARKGGSGGKSDEEKAAEKAARAAEKETEREQKELEKRQANQEKYRKTLEERTLQHYARLAKINQDYYKQAAENERKFNGEKFTEQANFWNSVADMEGGQRSRLLAEERRLWDESQKIAQTGRAAEAQAYYEAGLEIIEAQAQRDAKLAELRQAAKDATTEDERKAIEEEIALRQRADDQLTDQENQRLDRMKDAEDSVKKERDEALSEEQADYQEANQKLRDQFVETNEALVAYADQQMQLFAGLAQAAAEAQQAVHTFTPGSTAAPEPRAFGGGMYRNQPYLTGERGPELIVPQRNSTAIPAGRTAAIMAAERSIMQPPTTAIGPVAGESSSTNTTINMPITFATGTPTREIQGARQELAALIDERISKANRTTGIGALRRNRS